MHLLRNWTRVMCEYQGTFDGSQCARKSSQCQVPPAFLAALCAGRDPHTPLDRSSGSGQTDALWPSTLTALHSTALHCTAVHCTALHCTYTALHYTALTLYYSALYLYCPAFHLTPLHPRHPSCTTCCPQILVEQGPKFPATIRRISPRFTQQNFGSSCILIDRDWAALLLMKPSSTCQCCSMRVLTSPWLYGLIWSDLNDHYTTCNYSTILSLMKKSSYGQHSALLYVCDSGVPFLYHDLSQNHGCCQYHESMSIPRVFANTMSESMSIP